jgi:hypothetical protein
MAFWTFVSIAIVAFPTVMGLRAVTNVEPLSVDSATVGFTDDTILRGPISQGSPVHGRIDDLFAVEQWTLNATADQRVPIWCAPVAGSETDPRIQVLDPSGLEVASDDDGRGDRTAMIRNLVLPSSGINRILVDVWFTGPYVLGIQ